MLLGKKCRVCGETNDLEFDCIEPVGSFHHGKSTDYRATFYWNQFRKGNLQLLCAKTNAVKGDTRRAVFDVALATVFSDLRSKAIIKSGEYCEQLRQALSHRGNGG